MATKRAKALTDAVSKEMEERGLIGAHRRPTEGLQRAYRGPTEGAYTSPRADQDPGGRLEHTGGPGRPGGHNPERPDPKGDQGAPPTPGGGAAMMAVIGALVWVGLALLIAFSARKSGYSFWAYLVLSLLYVLMGWQTLRVARWMERTEREGLR